MNIFVGIFNNSDNNILADNAVLSRFFAVTDLTLNCVSDNLQYFNKVNENQKENSSDTFRYFNDLILSVNYNFSEQIINSTAFLFFISVACFMFIFCFKFNFILHLWRGILVEFLSKLLFSLLPRSVSIKTLLLNIMPCALSC